MLNQTSILVTGGTGSFGQRFVERLIRDYGPSRTIVFSRDELKQEVMRQRLADPIFNCIRYFIGDVRDKERLYRAFDGVDVVIHAAALKQVPAAEYNPIEAIKTNILGAANVIDAALDRGVKKVIALSTDKAANPVNLYGATKLCSDKLFIAARSYSTKKRTRFAVVRYGNVIGSRGSVVPLFLRQRQEGRITITDPRMTRFIISLEEGVSFVLRCLEDMRGGEVFVPKLPSIRVVDLASALAPQVPVHNVGIRPGEKLHETMIPEDDARTTLEFANHYVILPVKPSLSESHQEWLSRGEPCADGFRYSSDTNTKFLSVEEIRGLLRKTGFLQP
jgi:UDP-N-acetylglucosamine 4,6-dehydratase